MHYVIVDIETTGGSPKSSKITEIALYKHDGKQVIDEYVTLVNPEMMIPEFISRLTGISNKMVEESPKFFEIARKIIEFTENCIFVAHNVGFDYGILRMEFKSLGYDYRRPHLCTVRTSRFVLPGLESYSLGKLSRNLGIEIKGRHRAGGDALATAELFTILMEKDPGNLKTFIQDEVNPKILHPNLNIEELDNLPGKTGVYKFFDENNRLIYIGKSKTIKSRVDQHLRNSKTKKGIQMMKEIVHIEYELTGSELIALLRESSLIKHHKPIYNQALKRSKFPYGIFDYVDENGYLRLFIALTSKMKGQVPVISFTTKKEAVSYLEHTIEKYELCHKLCDLYPTKTVCFHYTIKQCHGACAGEETPETYNKRIQEFIDKLSFNGQTFYILDKGRNKSERSLILVENGRLTGIGYAPYHFHGQPPIKWKRYIELTEEDRDAKTILNLFLRKTELKDIIYF